MPLNMIPVLFTQKNSNYNKFPEFDCYDEKRDAYTYNGNSAFIVQPPCRLWGKYHTKSTAPISEKQMAFYAADLVRKNGGVLEHPSASALFKIYLPKPGVIDEYGGFTICVNQSWWGYPNPKSTFLYIVGIKPKELPDYTISLYQKPTVSFENLPKSKRSETPIDLCKWLAEIVTRIETKKAEQ